MPSPGFSLLVLLLFSDIAESDLGKHTEPICQEKEDPGKILKNILRYFLNTNFDAMLGFLRGNYNYLLVSTLSA